MAIFNYNLSAAQIQSLYLAAELAPFITTNPPPATVIVRMIERVNHRRSRGKSDSAHTAGISITRL